MSDLGVKIKEYRIKKGITQAELAKLIDTTMQNVSQYERGIRKPKIETLQKIAAALDVDVYSIADWDTASQMLENDINSNVLNPPITSQEMDIIKKYRALDAHGKDVVLYILDREYERATAETRHFEELQSPTISIDYYRLPVSAGTGTIDPGNGEHDTLTVLSNRYTASADYVVRVQGDSMRPRFSSGDLLLVRKTDTVDFGEIGVFSVDGRSYIKQAGCAELISLNPSYGPISLDSAAVYPQGRVIGILDPAWIV